MPRISAGSCPPNVWVFVWKSSFLLHVSSVRHTKAIVRTLAVQTVILAIHCFGKEVVKLLDQISASFS